MAWVRYGKYFHGNPQVTAVIAEDAGALSLHVLAASWSVGREPSFFVPLDQPERLVGLVAPAWADCLVRHGLWRVVADGYEVVVVDGLVGRFCWRQTIPRWIRAFVMARDGHRCVECGAVADLTLDHIWPWSRGGLDTVENLRVLCRSCNSRKGARI